MPGQVPKIYRIFLLCLWFVPSLSAYGNADNKAGHADEAGHSGEAVVQDKGKEATEKPEKKDGPSAKSKKNKRETVVPREASKGVRAECRDKLAGLYIEHYNDVETSGLKVKSLEKSIRAFGNALEGKRKERDAAIAHYQKERYNLNTERKITVLKDQAYLIEKHFKDDSDQLAAAKQKHENLLKARAELAQYLEQVFAINRNAAAAGYNIHIDYKTPCTKFLRICPLPEDQRRALEAMLEPIARITAVPAPESCQKYAQMLEIKPDM